MKSLLLFLALRSCSVNCADINLVQNTDKIANVTDDNKVLKGVTYVISTSDALSVHAPFLQGTIPNYSLYGAVDVKQESVHFGRGKPNLSGALWSKSPNPHAEWMLTARVKFTGGKVGGKGLALWYAKGGHSVGPVLGGPDLWTGLGILMDTFDDGGKAHSPAIIGILNDGLLRYDAANDGEGQYFGGCLRNMRNIAKLSVRVAYMRGQVKVEVDDGGQTGWVQCFEKKMELPKGYFFGISAATHMVPDTIELLDFQVMGAEPTVDHTSDSTNSPFKVQQGQQVIVQDEKSLFSQFSEMSKVMEAVVEKQILKHIPSLLAANKPDAPRLDGVGTRLESIVDEIAALRTQLVQLSLQRPDPSVGRSLEDMRGRVEALHQHRHLNTKPDDQWLDWKTIALFVAIQAAIMSAFLILRNKTEKKEKKWV